MAAAPLIARDHYWPAQALITVYNRYESLRTNHRMVRQMNQHGAGIGADMRKCGLDRGKLPAEIVGIVDHGDSRIDGNRAANGAGMRPDHHDQPRGALE